MLGTLGSEGEEGRRQERRRQEAGEGNFILEMELEKEGLYGCIHTLKGQLFQIAWMWTETHVLCAMLTWSLEVTINFAQDGIVNSL